MRPRQAVEVENDLLAVLDLRRRHLDDLRAGQLNGRVEQERANGKSNGALRGWTNVGALVRKVDVKLVLDGLDPEIASIWMALAFAGRPALPSEGDIAGSTAEQRRFRIRVTPSSSWTGCSEPKWPFSASGSGRPAVLGDREAATRARTEAWAMISMWMSAAPSPCRRSAAASATLRRNASNVLLRRAILRYRSFPRTRHGRPHRSGLQDCNTHRADPLPRAFITSALYDIMAPANVSLLPRPETCLSASIPRTTTRATSAEAGLQHCNMHRAEPLRARCITSGAL